MGDRIPQLLTPAIDRRQPYTEAGITRVHCSRPGCRRRARYQWNVCAAGNVYRAVCPECDVALNDLVLDWADEPEREALIRAYARRLDVDADAVRVEERRRRVEAAVRLFTSRPRRLFPYPPEV